MLVVRDLQEAEAYSPWGVVAIGVFDGMHAGHVEIFKRARDMAKRKEVPFSVITFHPHPDVVLGKAPDLMLIYSLEDRLKLFEAHGADRALVIPFDASFSKISPREFVKDFLVGKLKIEGAVVGDNFHFGSGARGDAWTLKSLLEESGVTVIVVERQTIGEMPVSSSFIRRALREGDVETAARLLGRMYCIKGTVVKGRGVGKKLGFPTINVKPYLKPILKHGVYAGFISPGGSSFNYPGVINWGGRPTFGDETALVEVHVIGSEVPHVSLGDEVAVFFCTMLREVMKFPSPQALIAQIKIDVERAREVLSSTCCQQS